MSIHTLIRERRKTLGLSEQKLADLVGVTRGAIQQWEREGGTAPKRAIRPKVAEALGLSVYDLTAAESESPNLGVAQSLSLSNFSMPPLVKWEALMKGKMPASFRCEMPDDALRESTPKGTVLLCSTSKEPEFGKGVIVKDRAGQLHVRRYAQGTGGSWQAEASTPGFKTLTPEQGATIVAAVVGRIDGSV